MYSSCNICKNPVQFLRSGSVHVGGSRGPKFWLAAALTLVAMSHPPIFQAKVVVMGAAAVGKTSLVDRFIHNTFTREDIPTIGGSCAPCVYLESSYI